MTEVYFVLFFLEIFYFDILNFKNFILIFYVFKKYYFDYFLLKTLNFF